jgi:hypothetical protein
VTSKMAATDKVPAAVKSTAAMPSAVTTTSLCTHGR